MLDLSHRLGKRKGLSEPHGAALPEACIDWVRQADAARAGTERVEQPIIQAVRCRIQGSVGRKNGDAARDAAEQRPLRGVAPAQALEALEDRWMVGDDQLGSEGFGFGHDFGRQLDREQRVLQRRRLVDGDRLEQEADVVPSLGKFEGRQALEYGQDFGERGGHGSIVVPEIALFR